MKDHAAMAGALLLACLGGADAQQPSGRVDLDLMASPSSQLVAARIAFTKISAACPQDHGILRFAGGVLRHHSAIVAGRTAPATESFKAIDGNAYRYRAATSDCQIDLVVRQQIRRAGESWQSLAVMRWHRPDLSPEERREALRQFQEDSRRRPSPVRPNDSKLSRVSQGSLGQGIVATISAGVVFEDAPAVCIDALGEFIGDQDGMTFIFLAGLPGELNRFAIERVDSHDDHSRIYFTRADCRYEITVSAATLKHGQWMARSIAPYVPSQVHIRRQSDPDGRPPWLDRPQ